MKVLAAEISRQLESETAKSGHCAIYEDELQRFWPLDQKDREAMIAQFAKEYGFRLRHYKKDCARSSINSLRLVSVKPSKISRAGKGKSPPVEASNQISRREQYMEGKWVCAGNRKKLSANRSNLKRH